MSKITAVVCLYGNRNIGAGWIVSDKKGQAGTGEPVANKSFTEAVYEAVDALKARGVTGTIRIFAAGGQHYAEVGVDRVPYFGDLKWNAA